MPNRSAVILAAGALALALPFAPARADAFRDEKLGYSFSAPAKWLQVPVEGSGSLVARFNSKQEYEWSDAKTNSWTRHCPWLQVHVIPFSVKDSHGATVEKTETGVKVTESIPWKNLREFLEQECRRIGGFHFLDEQEGTCNGLKVRRYEVAVDKNVEGERRVYGWEFEAADAYYGLVAEILAQEEKKLKPEILASFATFRTFPRTGRLPTATSENEITVRDPKKDANREVSPEEMKKKRDDAAAKALSRIRDNLSPGWAIVEGKNFTAVSHADPKFTREILQQAEAVRAWLETQFGFVGNGYAGRILVRICIDDKEYSSLQQSRGWSFDSPEVFTYRDRDGWSDWNLRGLNRSIYRIWLRDKNDRLLWGLPQWISWGLGDFVERARLNNGKLDFKASTWESVEMKTMRRSDSLLKPRDFFTLASGDLWGAQGNMTQTQFFVNFLLAGLGSRSPKYRTVLTDYIKNIIFLLDTESEGGGAAAKEPQNEKEEEEMIRARQEQWRKQERQTLDTLLEKTFPGWTDADWGAFNALYRQDLK